nr:hypothetical protein [Granulosicoccus sp.]
MIALEAGWDAGDEIVGPSRSAEILVPDRHTPKFSVIVNCRIGHFTDSQI